MRFAPTPLCVCVMVVVVNLMAKISLTPSPCPLPNNTVVGMIGRKTAALLAPLCARLGPAQGQMREEKTGSLCVWFSGWCWGWCWLLLAGLACDRGLDRD